jgi:hypothetical protein
VIAGLGKRHHVGVVETGGRWRSRDVRRTLVIAGDGDEALARADRVSPIASAAAECLVPAITAAAIECDDKQVLAALDRCGATAEIGAIEEPARVNRIIWRDRDAPCQSG